MGQHAQRVAPRPCRVQIDPVPCAQSQPARRGSAATKASSDRSACSRQTRSISSAWPGRQRLVGIQAPDALEQALAAQHLVAAGDAAGEVVGDVEEGAVAVGDARIQRQQFAHRRCRCSIAAWMRSSSCTALLRPHAPVAEQAAADAHRDVSSPSRARRRASAGRARCGRRCRCTASCAPRRRRRPRRARRRACGSGRRAPS